MRSLIKTQVENGLSALFSLRVQIIDMSGQANFTLKDSGLHDEEGKKTSISDLLAVGQRHKGCCFLFIIMVNPYQEDPNCKHNHMICKACIQLSLDVDGIDAIIDNQIIKTPYDLLVCLTDLYNGRNPDIGTLKKDRGDIFSSCCLKIFKANFYFMSMKYYLK